MKLKSYYKILLAFTLIFSTASSCTDNETNILLKDMAKFDQAFIPVLFFVKNGEMDQARNSVFFLNHNWQRFRSKYENLFPESDDWKESFRMSDAWLSDAYYAIDAFAPHEAFVFLDHVRYEFIDVRQQNAWKYFLDDVWEFEARMDLVEEVAIDEMLCLLDYCEFEELVDEMNEAWQIIELKEQDQELFEWNEDEVFSYHIKKGKLEDSIHRFNVAVTEEEGQELAIAASMLKNTYLDYLSSFGHFFSSKRYFASF